MLERNQWCSAGVARTCQALLLPKEAAGLSYRADVGYMVVPLLAL